MAEQDAIVNDIRQYVGYFDPNQFMALGTESAHQVVFGTISGLGEVAVKPYTKFDRARNEKGALEKADRLGVESFEPLAVAEGGLASYLVTRYAGRVHNLGMVDWNVGIANPRLRSVIVPTLEVAATTAANWHSKGVAQGDLHVGNLMYTVSGSSIFGDAERSSFHTEKSRHTLTANRDMQKMGKSMLGRGLLADRSPSFRVGFMEDKLLGPYLETVMTEKFDQAPEERRRIVTEFWASAVRSSSSTRAA